MLPWTQQDTEKLSHHAIRYYRIMGNHHQSEWLHLQFMDIKSLERITEHGHNEKHIVTNTQIRPCKSAKYLADILDYWP